VILEIEFLARRITAEGPIYGVLALSEKDNFAFYPIINKVYNKPISIKYTAIKGMLKYRYMMRHTAIEIWQYNTKYSLLFDLYEEQTREIVYTIFKRHAIKRQENLFSKEYVMGLWVNGFISNFEYLMFVNTISNRSFNDLSQYPIFPWVISDFMSESISSKNFSDL